MFKELDNYLSQLRLDYRAMALTYIINTGFQSVQEITDADVEDMRQKLKEEETGKELMTIDFQIGLVESAREIVKLCSSPVDLYQYTAIKGIFDLQYYAPGECTPREEKLLEIIRDFAQYGNERERNEINETLEEFGEEWLL